MKILPLLSLLASPLLYAAPLDSTHIPKSAEWYLHADLEQLRASQFGKVIVAEINKRHDDKIAEIEGLFKLNPLEDIHDVTLFGDGKENHVAVLIHGGMDREHLEKTIPHADDYKARAYGDVVIHTWMDDKGKKRQHAAFYGDDLLIFSDHRDLVKLTLDTIFEKKPPIKADDSALKNEILHGHANILKLALPDDDGSRLLRKAEELTISLKENADRLAAQFFITPKLGADAVRLAKVLDGLVAFGLMSDPNLDKLDLHTDFSANDGKVTMSATLPITQMLSLLDKLSKK